VFSVGTRKSAFRTHESMRSGARMTRRLQTRGTDYSRTSHDHVAIGEDLATDLPRNQTTASSRLSDSRERVDQQQRAKQSEG
jgi:hypothetical protein